MKSFPLLEGYRSLWMDRLEILGKLENYATTPRPVAGSDKRYQALTPVDRACQFAHHQRSVGKFQSEKIQNF